MKAYIVAGLLALLGAAAMAWGVLLGVSASANYLVEAAFTLFALAALVFVGSVFLGLAKEFRETA